VACFKLIFPVRRKSAASWLEEPATARRVRTPRRPRGVETLSPLAVGLMSQMPDQAPLLPIPRSKAGFPAFLPRRFRGRLNSSQEQQ
jgi:hypothetical protein